MRSAFAVGVYTDVGVERDPQFQDGYIWFDVVGRTSRERPLDEVKEQVETRWRDQEIATRLNARATKSSTSSDGRNFRDVATTRPSKLET